MGQWTKVLRNRKLVAFADPETRKRTLAFFEVVSPSESQDAPRFKKAMIDTFK